ncbi:MAG: hypothetical protein QMD92_08380 [bacterium]|nr:hypothetical protein [bacterium]
MQKLNLLLKVTEVCKCFSSFSSWKQKLLFTYLILIMSSFTSCGNLERSNPNDPGYKSAKYDISVYVTSPENNSQVTISQWVQLTFMGIAYKDGKEVTEWESYKWYVDGQYLFTGRNRSYYSFPIGWHDVILKVNDGSSYGVSNIVRFKVNSMY